MNIDRKVEIAFGGSFYDDPALLTWTDLSDSWTDDPTITVKLGRDRDLAAIPQAGTCQLRLTALDGSGAPTNALTPGNTTSPYYPNIVSGVPVRISAQTSDGTWWPVFYGLTESWNPTFVGNLADWSVVDLTCSTAWAALTQAGARRTYADRVVGDLAPALGEVWAAGIRDYGKSTMLYVAGGVLYGGAAQYNTNAGLAWPDAYEPAAFNYQRWGFAWLSLDNTGGKAWSVPGAACPVVETGGADSSGGAADGLSFNGGFGSDRPGGQYVLRGDGTCGVSAYIAASTQSNFARVQVFVGRPPTQLVPASLCAPVDTSGWTSVGTGAVLSLVASSALPHLPRTTAYNPVTKVTSAAVLDGPANSISWSTTGGVSNLTSVNFPVVAGKSYSVSFIYNGYANGIFLDWLNSVGTVLSSSTLADVLGGVVLVNYQGAGALVAPVGAVNARVRISGYSGIHTNTIGCFGVYEYPNPSRWWPVGADARIYAWVQWPDLLTGGMTSGTAGQIRWLHAQIDITAWDDGALHMIGWSGWPGVGGNPVVWADGVRVTTGWSVSWPGVNVGNDVGPVGTYYGSAMGGGFASNAGARLNTINPSALVVPAALLGASRYEVTPDDTLIGRAYSFFGGRKSLANPTYAGDTGAQATRALDQLGWPTALRDIGVGASNLPTTWADLSSLSDYSALIGDLTKAEYGWVDIGPDGHFRWLPRAWYGVGTATAVAHYSWRTGAGLTAYVPPLDVRWDDKDIANSIVVSNGLDFMTRSRRDLTSQRRGLRKFVVTLPGGSTQANIDAVADILAVVHAPGPRIESLTLRATSANDPMLAQILARKTGDVVLVDLPQLPAPDLTVAMLITSIEHTSDGIVWMAKLGLGVCPIPAVYP